MARARDQVEAFALYIKVNSSGVWVPKLALVDELLWHVNREAIACTDPRLAIHTSAVTWNGRAIPFPAPAGSGASTQAGALVMHGGAYVPDEATRIDLGIVGEPCLYFTSR
jgi:hypothetical protein